MSAQVTLETPSSVRTDGVTRIAVLECEHGTLRDVHVAWSTYGPEDAPAVLVLGGISATRRLLNEDGTCGWWPGVVGEGAALDPAHVRLIGVDYLGSAGDSSRPAHDGDWPPLTTADQARALALILDDLGIDALHALVGASYGGMVGLALAAARPERVERLIVLCAAHRTHPMATAWRSVQRRIVRLGADAGAPGAGVAIARALAMTTYRSAIEFEQRFATSPLDVRRPRFPVDDYLDHHAARYARTVPAPALLTLSESLDLHNVDPATITARCTLVAFDSDALVPLHDMRALAGALGPRGALHVVSTRYGHDGFLKEPERVGAIIADALAADPQVPVSLAPATHYAACADQAVRGGTARAARGAATIAARAGIGTDGQHGAVIAPIHLSTTFEFSGLNEKGRYDYTRSGNPTRDTLAATIAALEGGAAGIVTATGMAAITATLHLLRPGDLLVAPHDCYGGTHRLMTSLAARGSFRLELVNLTAADAAERVRALRPRVLWIETPSNPLLRITDIAALSAAAHEVGALVVADNTFLSPVLQTPIEHGADIVVHSTTKYLNGHSDVVGGAIVARDTAVAEEVGWWANCLGVTGSPFDSFLTQRGVRTLHARMRVHESNARSVVELLVSHPAVAAVYHPSLRDHPGHDIACRQQRGFGAMVSFELCGGIEAVERFVCGLECFSLAESLGGVESLVAHPPTMTHASMDAAARSHAGISDSLLRLSVGVEDEADLIADLERALERAAASSERRGSAVRPIPA